MATTGWKFPSTTSDAGSGNPTGSSTAWSNPNNVQADDTSWATQDSDGTTSQGNYLLCSNFGFTTGDIPSGSTINGIEIQYERRTESNAQDTLEWSVKIIKGGTVSGDEKADNVTAWVEEPTTEVRTIGGASDLWGLSWSDSDITASTFGIAIATETSGAGNKLAEINYVNIRVHYTAPGAGSEHAATFIGVMPMAGGKGSYTFIE